MAPASARPSACWRPIRASTSPRRAVLRLDRASIGQRDRRPSTGLEAQALRRCEAAWRPTASCNGRATRRCATPARASRSTSICPTARSMLAMRARAIEAFNAAYMRKHKFLDAEGTIEAVDWTLVATMPVAHWRRAPARPAAEAAAQPRARERARPGSRRPAATSTRAIIDRQALAGGATITGPAIIEDPDSTARHAAGRRGADERAKAISSSTSPRRLRHEEPTARRSHHADRDLELADLDRRGARRHAAPHGLLRRRARGRRLLPRRCSTATP